MRWVEQEILTFPQASPRSKESLKIYPFVSTPAPRADFACQSGASSRMTL
jgi:hypothetical protein